MPTKGYRLNFARLRKAREAAGMTTTQAAALAGVSERQLQRFESGVQEPRLSRLVILFDLYGVPHESIGKFVAPTPSLRSRA